MGGCVKRPKTFFHLCVHFISLCRLNSHPNIESQLLKINHLLASLNSLTLCSPFSLSRIGFGRQNDSLPSIDLLFEKKINIDLLAGRLASELTQVSPINSKSTSADVVSVCTLAPTDFHTRSCSFDFCL